MIVKSLKLGHESELYQRIQNAENEMWYDCLEEFFDQSNEELLLKNRPITNKQEKRKFVICFDNVEDLIS